VKRGRGRRERVVFKLITHYVDGPIMQSMIVLYLIKKTTLSANYLNINRDERS